MPAGEQEVKHALVLAGGAGSHAEARDYGPCSSACIYAGVATNEIWTSHQPLTEFR